MIEIQEVHEVKYNIKLDAEKLALIVYCKMTSVFDFLDKIKTEEDLKNISDCRGIIAKQIADIPFDDVMYILKSKKNQKEYVDEVIKCFAGLVIERVIKDNVPVKDPDIYRHCIFDDDNWIYNVQCKIVEHLDKKPFDNIYQKTIEVLKKYNYEYSNALNISILLGLDIKNCVYL